jgi:hypothetical protein
MSKALKLRRTSGFVLVAFSDKWPHSPRHPVCRLCAQLWGRLLRADRAGGSSAFVRGAILKPERASTITKPSAVRSAGAAVPQREIESRVPSFLLRGKANAFDQLLKAGIGTQWIDAGIDLEIRKALVPVLK